MLKKKSDTKSVTEIVEEKLSQKRLQEKMATGGMPYPHYTSTPPKKNSGDIGYSRQNSRFGL